LEHFDEEEGRPVFAHDVEKEFACILDYYGIRWLYEPRSFPLTKDKKGNITNAFAPDFYLPDEDLYVELTTMRPKLITRKNRKIRLLKELYPEINVKLFKRQDLRDLMIEYGLDEHAAAIIGIEAQNKR
jgi:hypoxanthine phosphoribosyltransferase